MNNRKRNVQIKFRVTEEERSLIEEKMKQVPTRNMEAYLRKMAIDGYIIQVDHSDIKKMTAELQRIGVNINQIAKRATTYEILHLHEQDSFFSGTLEKKYSRCYIDIDKNIADAILEKRSTNGIFGVCYFCTKGT